MAKYESKLYFSGKIHVLIEEYFTKTGVTNEFFDKFNLQTFMFKKNQKFEIKLKIILKKFF